METMKNQFSEHERRHDEDMRTIEKMQQTHRQQALQWDNERNLLVCALSMYRKLFNDSVLIEATNLKEMLIFRI